MKASTTPYMLTYDDEYCRNFVNLDASRDFPGIDGGVADATESGAIAVADQRCNPNFVMVKTEAPFSLCYCAAAGDMCTSRATNPKSGIFVPQALGSSINFSERADSRFRMDRLTIQSWQIHECTGEAREGALMAPFGAVGLGAARYISELAGPRSRVGRFTVRSSMDRFAIQNGPTQDPEWDESRSGVDRFRMQSGRFHEASSMGPA